MSLVIGIMDRNHWTARTDVIVIANPKEKTLTWIPRDLYCESIKDRINTSYNKGMESLFLSCLKELGYNNVKYCVCLLPEFCQECIQHISSIYVPLYKTLSFEYPLHRHKPIEDGKQIITFSEPGEYLSGDRIHEFIGARYPILNTNDKKKLFKEEINYNEYCRKTGHPNYARHNGFPDFNRIRRQQIFIKEWLKNKPNTKANPNYNLENIRGLDETTISLLKQIDNSWVFNPISENDYKSVNIKGCLVLQKKI